MFCIKADHLKVAVGVFVQLDELSGARNHEVRVVRRLEICGQSKGSRLWGPQYAEVRIQPFPGWLPAYEP